MFKHAYSYIETRFSVPLDFKGTESRTEQHHRTECDINVLLGRYRATGQLPAYSKMGSFMDVTSMDFQSAMDIVASGSRAFESLPSAIRNRFQNDPALFLDFVHDPANKDDLVKMGLAVAPKDDLVKMGLAVAPPAPPEAPSAPVEPKAP